MILIMVFIVTVISMLWFLFLTWKQADIHGIARATLCAFALAACTIISQGDILAAERQLPIPGVIKLPTKQIPTKEPRLPDITIRAGSISTTPSPPLSGAAEMGDTTLQAEVQNLGWAEATNFTVVFMFNTETTSAYRSYRVTVPSLPAHSSLWVSEIVRADQLPPAGTYRLKVLADIYPESVTESNERNNTAEQSIIVNGPDFAVSSSDIEISPAAATLTGGDTFTTRAPLRNTGTGQGLLGTRISLFDSSGRVLDEHFRLLEICAGGFSFVGARFTLPEGYGSYGVRYEADYNNRNEEPNEGNNIAEKYFPIR